MKKVKTILLGAVVIAAGLMSSCSKNQDQVDLTADVVGTYQGKLTNSATNTDTSSTTTITYYNDYTVRVHCVGGDLDTNFLLELYANGEIMNVCSTGEAYQEEYGREKEKNNHMMGNGSMMNWGDHMNEDHNNGDEHYGNFNTGNNEFDYEMKIENSTDNHSERFVGKK